MKRAKAPSGRLDALELAPVAAGGLLERRIFLRHGLAWSGVGLVAAAAGTARGEGSLDAPSRPAWMKIPGQPFSSYGQPSTQQRGVARWISANRAVPGNGVSWTPLHDLEGSITPSGLHFERHHNGVPQIPIDRHQLLMHGLVQRALTFSMSDLARYPMRSQILFIECGGNSNAGWHELAQQTRAGFLHGLASCSEWTGVPLSKARKDCLVALYQNGERVRPENGYPLRLIVPGWEGVLNVKWLRRLEVAREPVMARDETARYTELLPSGKARMFTFVMDAKSVITSPSPGHELKDKGMYEIAGLAWTGRGRIRA